MLDLLPASLDARLSAFLSPLSRWVSRRLGGPDVPLCARMGPGWARIIGRRHCAASREEWT